MNLLTPEQYAAAYARLTRAEANRDTVLGRLTADATIRHITPHSIRMDAEAARLAAADKWRDTPELRAVRLAKLNADADAINITKHRKQATAA